MRAPLRRVPVPARHGSAGPGIAVRKGGASVSRQLELDAAALLERVAERVPPALCGNVVVIGSIATAWAFRDVTGTHAVATKDIDVLLRPAIDAVTTAQALGQLLLDEGWQPRYPTDIQPGTQETPDDQLPALRLSPPADGDAWFGSLGSRQPKDDHHSRPSRGAPALESRHGQPAPLPRHPPHPGRPRLRGPGG